MPTISEFLLPPPSLAGCVTIGIWRDTRGEDLAEQDRLNYFPASPIFALTCVLEGQLHLSTEFAGLDTLCQSPPIPELSVQAPQNSPVVSWSPGPVAALTIGFYPHAWRCLTAHTQEGAVPDHLHHALAALDRASNISEGWEEFTKNLLPIWRKMRGQTPLANWAGSHRVTDWVRYLGVQVAAQSQGKSARTIERVLRRWAGQSQQSLAFYAKIEALHQLRTGSPQATLAEMASDAEFSDQSHMGRALKRATGFSPARLNALVDHEEAFWCYRLLGTRF